jgi:hypothetical protein
VARQEWKRFSQDAQCEKRRGTRLSSDGYKAFTHQNEDGLRRCLRVVGGAVALTVMWLSLGIVEAAFALRRWTHEQTRLLVCPAGLGYRGTEVYDILIGGWMEVRRSLEASWRIEKQWWGSGCCVSNFRDTGRCGRVDVNYRSRGGSVLKFRMHAPAYQVRVVYLV